MFGRKFESGMRRGIKHVIALLAVSAISKAKRGREQKDQRRRE